MAIREAASLEELKSMIALAPERTQTFLVTQDVLRQIGKIVSGRMRQMSRQEDIELADYLETPVEALKGPFAVTDSLSCGNCGRKPSFLDFVRTASALPRHDKGKLKAILCGEGGEWLTVAGEKETRTVACGNCGKAVAYSGHSYSGATYGYASVDLKSASEA